MKILNYFWKQTNFILDVEKSEGPHILELIGDSAKSLNVKDDFEDFSSMKFDEIDEDDLFFDNLTYTSEQDDNAIRITISSGFAGQSEDRDKRSTDRSQFGILHF